MTQLINSFLQKVEKASSRLLTETTITNLFSFDYLAKIEVPILTKRNHFWQSLHDFMENSNNRL